MIVSAPDPGEVFGDMNQQICWVGSLRGWLRFARNVIEAPMKPLYALHANELSTLIGWTGEFFVEHHAKHSERQSTAEVYQELELDSHELMGIKPEDPSGRSRVWRQEPAKKSLIPSETFSEACHQLFWIPY